MSSLTILIVLIVSFGSAFHTFNLKGIQQAAIELYNTSSSIWALILVLSVFIIDGRLYKNFSLISVIDQTYALSSMKINLNFGVKLYCFTTSSATLTLSSYRFFFLFTAAISPCITTSSVTVRINKSLSSNTLAH